MPGIGPPPSAGQAAQQERLVAVSASECSVLANGAAEPVSAAANALATVIARPVAIAIATVARLSLLLPLCPPRAAVWERRIAFRAVLCSP